MLELLRFWGEDDVECRCSSICCINRWIELVTARKIKCCADPVRIVLPITILGIVIWPVDSTIYDIHFLYNTAVLKKVHTHLCTFIGQQWRTNKLQKVGHYWHLQTEKFLEISNFNRFDRQVYLCLAALLEMKKHNCIVRPTGHTVRAGRIGTIKCPWRGWTLCWSLCVKCRLRFPGPSTLSEE